MYGRLALLAVLLMSGAAAMIAAGALPMPNLPWSINSARIEDAKSDKDKPREADTAPVQKSVEKSAASEIEQTTAALGLDEAKPAAPKTQDGPSLDVSRVSPTGSSVFAGGGAEPKSYVTLMENGTPVGTVQADDHGDWSLVTEHRFASLDPKITFKTDSNPPPKSAPPSEAIATASSPAAEVLQKFEGLVAEAREHAKVETKTASNAPLPQVETATATGKTLAQHVSIPVPIMFVYNEATLTDEGRRAADLLLEYVQLEHLPTITLSGHADERGSDGYNMDLSRERLETVARILRDGGYSGQLDLKAKGKSEPFAGVDRSKYAIEALYQLDRRVELHIIR